ncbi:MAG TPA: lanthionine synthetase C family protein [Thermoanaerobaculia bacterium]|nr:lanthionine synthetase C family protein [Thermoanaerobaculia bacterium]
MKSRLWRPLLDGNLAVRAWGAVNAVAQALEVWSPGNPHEYHPESWLDRVVSLGGGAAGQALFHGYLFKAEGAERHAARAQQLLNQAVESLAMAPAHPALYSGFTGVAWAAEHLGRLLNGEEEQAAGEDEDAGEEIDQALLTALDRFSWAGDYDLISGLVGFGVYALERFPRRSAVRCLEAIVDRLDESAERNGQEVTWFRPPEVLPGAVREHTPHGYYDLGVAHGVPGIIALLADACRLEVRQDRARPLLDGAVRWLALQPLASRKGACFPSRIGPGIEATPSRLAWCYGDPGIAATLLYAARAVGVKEWEDRALAIAAHAASAAPEDAGVRDMGLCHGALGLAHLYNRIYQAGGDELFADAARLWYRLGLEMHKPEGGGGAGIEARVAGQDSQSLWAADPGFLTGAAGIGLALLAAVTPVEPEWDHLLLVAIPPRET